MNAPAGDAAIADVRSPSLRVPDESGRDGPRTRRLRAAVDVWRRGARDATLDGVSLIELAEASRAALGFAADLGSGAEPLVVTGHQPEAWHAGIAVKYLLAARLGRPATLMVDHHAATGLRLDLPVTVGGHALSMVWVPLVRRFGAGPLATAPARTPEPPPTEPDRGADDAASASRDVASLPAFAGTFELAVPDAVRAGAGDLHRRLVEHAQRPTMAEQIARAVQGGLERWTGTLPLAGATDLVRTPLGRALVRRLAVDGPAAIAAYRRAVRSIPEAGLRPLLERDDVVEVPLWRLEPDGRRLAAFDWDLTAWLEAVDAGATPPFDLAPRALLLTAIARLGAGDVFVHGLGGAVYDRATAAWIRAWLGLELAPMTAVSADVRLDPAALAAPPDAPLDPAAARRRAAILAARAHRTWHDPETHAGDRGPGPVKRDLLRGVDAAARGSRRRRGAFRAMHEQLSKLRGLHAGRVARANDRARTAQIDVDRALLLERRDWYWDVHPTPVIDALDAEAGRRAAAMR